MDFFFISATVFIPSEESLLGCGNLTSSTAHSFDPDRGNL